MASEPSVAVNLYVYNDAAGIRLVLDSLLAQTWPNFTLTLFDDGSTDATAAILEAYAPRFHRARVYHNGCNTGEVTGFQRALRWGGADFVMPKSGDDPVAPTFIARLMEVLRAYPECAMCHASGLVFTGEGAVQTVYPSLHRLSAVGADPVARAVAVMRSYTTSPSLYGIYRRGAVERVGPIRYGAGWDHAFLAELALYGEIRHVPEVLYWRRDGGAPVSTLARRLTRAAGQGVSLDGPLAEARWRTPLITTAYGHLEAFAVARVGEGTRGAVMARVPEIFRERWLTRLLAEAGSLRRALPSLIARVAALDAALVPWGAAQIREAIEIVRTILPDEDFEPELEALRSLCAGVRSREHGAAG